MNRAANEQQARNVHRQVYVEQYGTVGLEW